MLSDLLMHLGGDYWALNATYLLKPSCRYYLKPHTCAGKGLLRSIGRFFRHVGELIGKGIKRVIRIPEKLFRWFKNTAQVTWRELKELYSVMSQALSFFFSKRQITTVQNGQSIVTDFPSPLKSSPALVDGSGWEWR